MPYALKGDCVVKKDSGAVVKCHDSHAKAVAHLAALEINVVKHEKEQDVGLLNKVKEWLTSIFEKKQIADQMLGTVSVTKEVSGKWRWTLIASGAYGPDRDGEWMTEKALRDWADSFVAKEAGTIPVRANGESVPARWWHVGNPDPRTRTKGVGLDLGTCDIALVHSKSLIMSGTFEDPDLGAVMAAKADKLGASVGFFHPLTEPKEKAFSTIDVYEVSFLPVERASYPFTGLAVMKGS